jgi:hypothetical protein
MLYTNVDIFLENGANHFSKKAQELMKFYEKMGQKKS